MYINISSLGISVYFVANALDSGPLEKSIFYGLCGQLKLLSSFFFQLLFFFEFFESVLKMDIKKLEKKGSTEKSYLILIYLRTVKPVTLLLINVWSTVPLAEDVNCWLITIS